MRQNASDGPDPVWSVVLIFASGIVINLISDLLQVSGFLIVIIALVIAVAMIASQSGARNSLTLADRVASSERQSLVLVALLALLIGFAIGGIAVIPWRASSHIDLALGLWSYELGAGAAVAAAATLVAIRRRPIPVVASFAVGSVGGMTLAIMTFKGGENETTPTYLGWLAVTAVCCAIAYLWRELGQTLRYVFWSSDDARDASTQTMEPESEDDLV